MEFRKFLSTKTVGVCAIIVGAVIGTLVFNRGEPDLSDCEEFLEEDSDEVSEEESE